MCDKRVNRDSVRSSTELTHRCAHYSAFLWQGEKRQPQALTSATIGRAAVSTKQRDVYDVQLAGSSDRGKQTVHCGTLLLRRIIAAEFPEFDLGDEHTLLSMHSRSSSALIIA
jgi:hypothetical protein